MKKEIILLIAIVCSSFSASARKVISWQDTGSSIYIVTDEGRLKIIPLTDNSVRVQFKKEKECALLQELVYLPDIPISGYTVSDTQDSITISLRRLSVSVKKATGMITFYKVIPSDNKEKKSNLILAEKNFSLQDSSIQGEKTYVAEQSFVSPPNEYLFGLGQFQDGYLNVRGLIRRLTQVNTQISIPFILSNKGYGLLWNNYGMTEFNPANQKVNLKKEKSNGVQEEVDVTSTEGTKRELRESNSFSASLNILHKGRYALLLDVGQKMARMHHLEIDGKTVLDMKNMWLPPTTSIIINLDKGTHVLTARLTKDDKPQLYYKEVENSTTFRSPVSQGIDYTIFAGDPEEVIASYRKVTGAVPMLPLWALGYIHCRERFHSQHEILATAQEFREKGIPVDVIVQDWQYWGKYGWNAMQFDEGDYPDPKILVDSLHSMHMRFMLSVWSKIDPNSEVGQYMQKNNYYIPNTSWIDFFNPRAATAYWNNFNSKLLKPYGIDAWWQDATEPENDDLQGRRVDHDTIPGECVRNIYPLMVCKTVYEGSRKSSPDARVMILTRSGFSGIQRYGVATWSGDIGNDWETLRRQITGGLGQMASGLPWWTYDAGGFFRPVKQQYTDKKYHERFLRWFQTGVFLPLLRVHGYMTDTEFWKYGHEVTRIARNSLDLRYRLLPYIYSEVACVSFKGSTLMRPLVMDFVNDTIALSQKYEFMFGPSLLVAPILKESPIDWKVYLPRYKAGWIDFWTGKKFKGGQYIQTPVTLEHIPLFVKAGTILPLGDSGQYTEEALDSPREIRIYPGADATYTLYEDEGLNYNYEKNKYTTIPLKWNDADKILQIGDRKGTFEGMKEKRKFNIIMVSARSGLGITQGAPVKAVVYTGKKINIKL